MFNFGWNQKFTPGIKQGPKVLGFQIALFPALLQFLRRRSGATHAHSSGRIRFETARETIPIHNLPLVLVHTVDFSEILHQLIDGLSHYL